VSRAVGVARALILLLLVTALVGVWRTTRYALMHDPLGSGSVALWVWLLAPLCGGLVWVLVMAMRGSRGMLRRSALFVLGAASGEFLAFLTYLVAVNRVPCVNVYGNDDDCALGLAIGIGVGSVLLFGVLVFFGAFLYVLSWLLRRGGMNVPSGRVWGKLDWSDDGDDAGRRRSPGDRPGGEP
jgi:hypothetical protein